MPVSLLRRPPRFAAAAAACSAVLLAGGLAAAALAAAPAAQAAPGGHAAARARASALSANWYESAPYYSTMDSSVDLSQVMSATGTKAFDMAFILAGGGACTPSWDGSDPVSSDTQGPARSARSAPVAAT